MSKKYNELTSKGKKQTWTKLHNENKKLKSNIKLYIEKLTFSHSLCSSEEKDIYLQKYPPHDL
jgi:hypothetical protein